MQDSENSLQLCNEESNIKETEAFYKERGHDKEFIQGSL